MKTQEQIDLGCQAKARHVEDCINRLANAYNFTPTDGQIRALSETFSKLEISVLYQSVDQHINTSSWFPKPNEIRAIAQTTSAIPHKAWLWDRYSKFLMDYLAGKYVDMDQFKILQQDYVDEFGPAPTGQWIMLEQDPKPEPKDPFKPGQTWADYVEK